MDFKQEMIVKLAFIKFKNECETWDVKDEGDKTVIDFVNKTLNMFGYIEIDKKNNEAEVLINIENKAFVEKLKDCLNEGENEQESKDNPTD